MKLLSRNVAGLQSDKVKRKPACSEFIIININLLFFITMNAIATGVWTVITCDVISPSGGNHGDGITLQLL